MDELLKQAKVYAEAIDAILGKFGVRNSEVSFDDPTVSEMMVDDDLIYTSDNIKIFSVGQRMYVVDQIFWHNKQDSLKLQTADGSVSENGKVACAHRMFIWDTNENRYQLFREASGPEPWKKQVRRLYGEATGYAFEELDEDTPITGVTLMAGFVE